VEVKCGYGFVWFEDFEKKKEGQWAQEIEIRSNPLETASLSLMKKTVF
jgi:hypothetical protein